MRKHCGERVLQVTIRYMHCKFILHKKNKFEVRLKGIDVPDVDSSNIKA